LGIVIFLVSGGVSFAEVWSWDSLSGRAERFLEDGRVVVMEEAVAVAILIVWRLGWTQVID
jgi:hypothetical protein